MSNTESNAQSGQPVGYIINRGNGRLEIKQVWIPSDPTDPCLVEAIETTNHLGSASKLVKDCAQLSAELFLF